LRRRRVGEAASGISTLAVSNSTFASNTALADAPEKVNADAYGNWLYRLKPSDAGGLGGLLDAAAYTKLIGSA
jgi:glycine cleavage system H protein